MLHADVHEGGIFSGKHAILWDLNEDDLRSRLLAHRETGQDVWLDGKPFGWEAAVLRIYDGPPTADVPDFSPMLGPGAYAATGVLTEVTDRYVTGPPGRSPEAQCADHEDPRTVSRTAIFVVHGANVAWREEVARSLAQVLGGSTEVVILHEQLNQGQTILEKLERAADRARYAVVLLTGDDEGRRRGDERLEMRARQNVVLELGYFMGALGRGNTAVLYETGVDVPSDLAGLAYILLDEAGGWKLKLLKELRSAQIDVDVDRLI